MAMEEQLEDKFIVFVDNFPSREASPEIAKK